MYVRYSYYISELEISKPRVYQSGESPAMRRVLGFFTKGDDHLDFINVTYENQRTHVCKLTPAGCMGGISTYTRSQDYI